MMSGVVRSGASVTSVRPPLSDVSSPMRVFVQPAQLRGVVHALALLVEERPFDVDAEHAGHALFDGGLHGAHGL